MADYVEQTGCGRVVDSVSAADILAAIESLAAEYTKLRESAQEVGHRDFSEDRLVDSSRNMYERVLGHRLSRQQSSR
jgi:UDP:flavonoid glycosyltransferase YjiC (YdhE family)